MTSIARQLQYVALILLIAFPLALCLMLLLPGTGKAHAILQRSAPAQNEPLSAIPTQIRLWFSANLNAEFSTVMVVSADRRQVDAKDSRVSPNDPRELAVSLQPGLVPGIYVVLWRSQSTDDGHLLTGSFTFSIAGSDGTLPKPDGALPGTELLGSSSAQLSQGQLDSSLIFNLIMLAIFELGVVFWVGAQLWHTFVLDLSETGDPDASGRAIEQETEQRFERLFSLPTLYILLLAHFGVILGQALFITGGNWAQTFSPAMLLGLATNGQFGMYWLIRGGIILLAIATVAHELYSKWNPPSIRQLIPWANLLFGLALLITMALSGHATAAQNDVRVYAVLVDWLHLLAASLWVGGMFFISLVYMPTLKEATAPERAHSLLTILGRFSPLAITGVIIIAATGPFNAVVHITSADELFTTPYGRTLIIKVLLVAALLLTSAIHVGLFRPRLSKMYKKYLAVTGPSLEQVISESTDEATKEADTTDQRGQAETEVTTADKQSELERATATSVVQELQPVSADQTKQLEKSLDSQTERLMKTLRWEPVLGVAILLCAALLNIFAGTLQPPVEATSQQQTNQPTVAPPKPFNTTVKTSDNAFTLDVNVSPNRFGVNSFTVKVLDSSGKPDTTVKVKITTNMLNMNMGTETMTLQSDGNGSYIANGILSMGGDWLLLIQIQTPDNETHDAKVTLFTSY